MDRSPPAACTIIARNYLSHARILARSYLEHEPGARFYVLVVDRLPDGVEVGPGVQVVEPEELGLPYLHEMCFKYDVTELCTAVKPSLLSLLFERYGEESVIYFDPDIIIMRPLDELRAALSASCIVLTPHLLEPIPRDGRKPGEQEILIAGAYNLGFIALRKTEQTQALVRWWEARLRDDCRVDPGQGLFVDQRWVDLVPSLFPESQILYDETYNVAYWNLHSRPIRRDGEHFLVKGRPLAFYHFSGFDPTRVRVLSKHQNRIEVRQETALAELLQSYADLHLANGYAECSKWPYGYSRFDNGLAVDKHLRELYQGLDDQSREWFGNPFEARGERSFFEWATGPRDGKLSAFLEGLYQARPDVAAMFPDVDGRDREGFLAWASELGYDQRLVRNEPCPTIVEGATEDGAGQGAPEQPGCAVNVCGYLRAADGLGAIARGYVSALRAAGVPFGLTDCSELSPVRSQEQTLPVIAAPRRADVNLVCINADQHFVVMSQLGEQLFRDRYNIGVWFWELTRFPEQWTDRFAYYDEIWVSSAFVANALAPVSPIPVVRIPPVLATPGQGSREAGRRRLGVSADEVVYLFIFDFRSYFERKNPLALIDAFQRAFRSTDPARLVIKCVNEDFRPEGFAALRARAAGSPITIEAGYWSSEDLRDLMAACDAYVSLHRSEGLGLTIAEAMAQGKPVIATDWSGNVDFMNVSNSFPVAYELVELTEDIGPYAAGEVWAEPSVEHAAELMRAVFDDRALARARGEAGRREIEMNFSVERVGGIIEQRLAMIAGHPGAVWREAMQVPNGVPARRPARLRAPIVPAMDLNRSRYGLVGQLAKRAAAVLLRHQQHYQRVVNHSFSAFMRELEVEQAAQAERMRQLEARVRWLEASLEASPEVAEPTAGSANAQHGRGPTETSLIGTR
jgi:glycosyltransferase involved in cell wall biosynthesis